MFSFNSTSKNVDIVRLKIVIGVRTSTPPLIYVSFNQFVYKKKKKTLLHLCLLYTHMILLCETVLKNLYYALMLFPFDTANYLTFFQRAKYLTYTFLYQ